MQDRSLQHLITVRDEILDIIVGRVKYKDLARWSRVLSEIIQQEVDNATEASS